MLRWLTIVGGTFRSAISTRHELSLENLALHQQLVVHQTSSTASAADRRRSRAIGSVVPGLVWLARIAAYRSTGHCRTVVTPRRFIAARHAAKMGNNWRAFVNKNSIMPFALILQGRNVLAWAKSAGGELRWRAWLSVFFVLSRPTVQRISDRGNLRVSV